MNEKMQVDRKSIVVYGTLTLVLHSFIYGYKIELKSEFKKVQNFISVKNSLERIGTCKNYLHKGFTAFIDYDFATLYYFFIIKSDFGCGVF